MPDFLRSPDTPVPPPAAHVGPRGEMTPLAPPRLSPFSKSPTLVTRRPDTVARGPDGRDGIIEKKDSGVGRQLAGHANIATTQRYMHLDDRELAEAQDLVD